jgi:hypothetical protein
LVCVGEVVLSSRHKHDLLLAPTVSPVIHLCSLFFLSAVARQVHTSTEDCTVWPTTLFLSVCGRVSIAALANRRSSLSPPSAFFVCQGLWNNHRKTPPHTRRLTRVAKGKLARNMHQRLVTRGLSFHLYATCALRFALPPANAHVFLDRASSQALVLTLHSLT